jgi:hypothetical protein
MKREKLGANLVVTLGAPIPLGAARRVAILLTFPNIEKVSARSVNFERSFRPLNFDDRELDFLALDLGRDRDYRGLGVEHPRPDRDDGQKCGGRSHGGLPPNPKLGWPRIVPRSINGLSLAHNDHRRGRVATISASCSRRLFRNLGERLKVFQGNQRRRITKRRARS